MKKGVKAQLQDLGTMNICEAFQGYCNISQLRRTTNVLCHRQSEVKDIEELKISIFDPCVGVMIRNIVDCNNLCNN